MLVLYLILLSSVISTERATPLDLKGEKTSANSLALTRANIYLGIKDSDDTNLFLVLDKKTGRVIAKCEIDTGEEVNEVAVVETGRYSVLCAAYLLEHRDVFLHVGSHLALVFTESDFNAINDCVQAVPPTSRRAAAFFVGGYPGFVLRLNVKLS